jgi:hypothetical protein
MSEIRNAAPLDYFHGQKASMLMGKDKVNFIFK